MSAERLLTDASEELGAVALALRAEREEEERRMAAVLNDVSLKQRKEEGLSRSPLTVARLAFVYGGQPEITLERNRGTYPPDQFASGTPVFVYKTDQPENKLKGVVGFASPEQLRIILQGDDFPDDVRSGAQTVDLRFDDKTFFEMEKALNRAINLEAGEQRDLRDIMLGYKVGGTLREANESDRLHEISGDLNPSQRKAVEAILLTRDVALVHGPPGTGKTTTLVEAIRLASRKNEKTLVCAPTNAAADLLTMKLAAAGVEVVRLGHTSRVGEDSFSHAFDVRLEAMPEMKLVRDLRKRAEEAISEANKFKRTFGAEDRKARAAARMEAKQLRGEARETEKFAEMKLLEGAQAIVCTLVGASDHRLNRLHIDNAVIDEAGQALEPAAWIAVLRARKVVLAGDPCQLPPTVKSSQAARMGLSVTLLEKAIARTGVAVLLDEQYRMNSLIMGFSNHWFYGGKLRAHTTVTSHALSADEPALEFIDTAGCGYAELHPTEGSRESLINPEEAAVLVRHLDALLESHGAHIKSIGVIAPYRAQVELLKNMLPGDDRIVAQTVDGFQGRERDVVYISLTRSNDLGTIGFLADYRRMNVAMTRARRKLVVIGDSATLGADNFYLKFVEYCERAGVYRWGG